MKVKRIRDIETALRIFYTYPEIGNVEIRELFEPPTSSTTITRYKDAVKIEQAEQGVKTSQQFTVNTELAYKVWGIDVKDLEKRRDKLKKLGLSA